MMLGHLIRKINLMSLVAIFTQPTALLQQGYLEPGIMSQVCYFVSRILYKWSNYTKRKNCSLYVEYKGQRFDNSCKTSFGFSLWKCVYTKPKSKSVKLANDKKNTCTFPQLRQIKRNWKITKILETILLHFWNRTFLRLVLFYHWNQELLLRIPQ